MPRSHANFEGFVGDGQLFLTLGRERPDEWMRASLSRARERKTLNTLYLESIPASRQIVPAIGGACGPGD
jgi:hypothetical protein